MFSNNEMLNFMDHHEEHEIYYYLMEECVHTAFGKEIIDFMYLVFPEWTSNRGVGTDAANFLNDKISDLEVLYYEDEHPESAETLKEITKTKK